MKTKLKRRIILFASLCLLPAHGRTAERGSKDLEPAADQPRKAVSAPESFEARSQEMAGLTTLLNSDNPDDIQKANKVIYASLPSMGFYFNMARAALEDDSVINKHLADKFVQAVAHACDKHPKVTGPLLWNVTESAMCYSYATDFDSSMHKIHGSEAWWLGSKMHAALSKP